MAGQYRRKSKKKQKSSSRSKSRRPSASRKSRKFTRSIRQSSRRSRAGIIRRRVCIPTHSRNKGRRRGHTLNRSTIDFSRLQEPKTMAGTKFNHYIKKVLKKIKPRVGINAESTRIVDRLMKDTLHQIASQASTKMGRRKVLVPKVIVRGMRQILPKAIRIKADENAQKALTRFKKSKKKFNR